MLDSVFSVELYNSSVSAPTLNGTASGYTTIEYQYPINYHNGTVDMVLFPGGYATLSGSNVTFHYYTLDYLGNNSAVINGSTGAIEQTVACYPMGINPSSRKTLSHKQHLFSAT